MINNNEQKILNIVRYKIPIFIILSFIFIIFIIYYEETLFFKKEKVYIKNEFIKKNKATIKQNVENIIKIINNAQKTTEEDLIKELKEYVSTAHSIATSLYEKNKHTKTKEEIKKIIVDTLRNIRFNDNRGYYFIYDKKGQTIMLPPNPDYEGYNFYNHKDLKGKYTIKEMIKHLKSSDEVILDWYWYKPNHQEKQMKKIGIAKNFAPLNWFIGTGEYLKDFEKKVQKRVLKTISNIKFGENSYIFIFNYDYTYLAHINKNYIEKNALNVDDMHNRDKIIQELEKIAKNGGGYYSYIQKQKPDNQENIRKTSYVKAVPNWSWVIGTGYYEDDFKKAIEKKELELNKKIEKYFFDTTLFVVIIIIIFIIIVISFSNHLNKLLKKHKEEIDTYINQSNKQHKILAQQSKMAAMGEMIGNIAHQWRQPLSVITSAASLIKIQNELNTLKNKDCSETMEQIINSANYLSNTIDDFRYFFIPNKEKKEFINTSLLSKAYKFINADISKNKITIIEENIESFKIKTYENELLQVILNLLNNSKDELGKQEIKNRFIFINFYKKNNEAIIKIKDSAGGIPLKIMDRIFEPYFTTKHQSKGTGVGLYMSLEIVKKHLKGTIEAKNESYSYNDIDFSGAEFIVKFPL